MLELVRKQQAFDDIRMIVSERDSIEGATVYKVIDVTGKINISKTVDVAHFISKYGKYDNLVLNYDTMSGILDVQIIIYEGSKNTKNVSTILNEQSISNNLVELAL